jgi:Na+-driven multidrug efflux pump
LLHINRHLPDEPALLPTLQLADILVVGEVTLAFSNGINSALIIFCIALGVAVPNIFARRYIAKDRQRFLTQMLAERRARGKFIEW